MTTTNWNCPNGMIVDGFYSLAGTVNGKQAWQKSDGIYLRWASMFTEWVFDEDEEDGQSVASSDGSSVVPAAGTYDGYRYGPACGNNGHWVELLTITEVDCGSKLN